MVRNEPRTYVLGLFLHLVHEPRTLDHVGKARIVLDIGRDGELTPGLDSGNQYRFQHGAGGIDRGGVASWSRTDDDDLGVYELGHSGGSNGTHCGCELPDSIRAQCRASQQLCKSCNPRSHQNVGDSHRGWRCAIMFSAGRELGLNPPAKTVSGAGLEGPMPSELDTIDRHILKELQANGRITNVELARRVGISAPPCLRRVRALQEAGYIKGYRALLDERKLGYEVTVFAMVHLASQAEADLVAFEEFVRAQPLVRECWMLSGEIDFVLKCIAPDLKTFQAFVEKLTAARNVRNVKTSLTLRNSKDAAMVPMEE